MPPLSDSRGREDELSSSRKGLRTQPRGRSIGATSGGSGSVGAAAGVGSRPAAAAGEATSAPPPPPGAAPAPAHKRQRSKSRSGRLVSQLKGIVGAGKGKSSRRSSAASMGNGRAGQYSLSDDDEEDSYEDDDGDFGRRASGDNGGGTGNGGGGGTLTTASQAAQLPRGHRRSSSASGTASLSGLLGTPSLGGSTSNLQRYPPGSMSNLRAAADVQMPMVAGSRLPRAPTAVPLGGGGGGRSRGGAAGGAGSGRGSALSATKPPAPRNSE